MGKVSRYSPALFMAAHFSCHKEALAWSRGKLSERWGEIACESELFTFDETDYYSESMGRPLYKQLLAFRELIPQESLVEAKLCTNQLESDYTELGLHSETRPLNIDPGFMTLAKFVLATTKEGSHRLPLGSGIYGEVTLHFVRGRWQDWPWTYPDYKRDDYKAFLFNCRERLIRRLETVESNQN